MNQPTEIKVDFKGKFQSLLEKQQSLKDLLLEIFVFGTAYVVGGFLRDALDNKTSRDIDIIVDVDHELVIHIIKNLQLDYEVNRHNGIKIKLNEFEADIWSIKNNWAFKNNLVKLNEEDKLNSIAKGCFYNFDSLVINLHRFNFNIRHYKEFNRSNVLEILQKSPAYKNLNPTIEANILRAIYIEYNFKSKFSENTFNYLGNSLKKLKSYYNNPVSRLIEVKNSYTKYGDLSEALIKERVESLFDSYMRIDNQYLLPRLVLQP